MNRRVLLGCATVWLGTAVFLALIGSAMSTYSGGNWQDRAAHGYSQTRNFFSDLLRQTALNGAANPGATRALVALASLSVALVAFFLLLPCRFPEHRRLGAWVRALGGVSGVGAIAVVLMPSDRFPRAHGTAIGLAAAGGLNAALLAVVGLALGRAGRKLEALLGVACLFTTGGNVAQYAREFWGHASPWYLLPAVQKAATVLLVLWMLAVTKRACGLARRLDATSQQAGTRL